MLMLRRKMLMLRRKTDAARTQTYTFCETARLRSANALQHVTRAATIQKFTGKNAADQSEHPDQAPAFTSTVRTPQCGLTVWGTNRQIATACKRATSGLLDFWTCRWPGHTGTRAQPDPRAHGHTGTTPIHGHTGTRAHGQGPPEDNTRDYDKRDAS